MIYLFLSEGFEECEALVPLDILRRADIEVKTVGVGDKTITGAHGIPVICDTTTDQVTTDNIEAIILPGGMPGTVNLESNKTVQAIIDYCANNKLLIGAICAAPSILGHKNLLKAKNAVCFPGFEKDLIGANVCNKAVVKDGNIITAIGAGAAFEFGFEILTALKSQDFSDNLKSQMKYNGV